MSKMKQKTSNKAMAIEEVSTRKGITPVTIVIGRFQPPHLGHKKIIEVARGFKGRTAIVMIRPSISAADTSPFDEEVRVQMINELVRREEDIIVPIGTGFIGDFIHVLREFSYEPVRIVCGTDRAEGYHKQINRYKKKLNLAISIVEVSRGLDDVSATKVRETLKSKDEKEFKKLMPEELHSFFEPLTEMIWQSHPPTV